MYYFLLSLFVLILSNLTGTAQHRFRLEIEPYTFVTENKQEVAAELGSFYVPENRQKEHSKEIQLKFVRFKSTNPNPGVPVVYLAGGPGGSGIMTARGSRFGLFMAMREIADVIAFDQRGTGFSHHPLPYTQSWNYPLDEILDREKAHNITKTYAQEAMAFWKENQEDVGAYNTRESADDLNDLRQALGAPKISLWGISYGTHLGLATLKRHGVYIDKAILAGVEGPDHTVKLPANSQKLLEKIQKLSAAEDSSYGSFLEDLASVLNQLDKNPVWVNLKPYHQPDSLRIKIGKFDLQLLFAAMLRGPEFSGQLPALVQEMQTGNFSDLPSWILYFRFGTISPMSDPMDVASGISPERMALVKKQEKETLLGGAINFPYWSMYEGLDVPDLGPEFRSPVRAEHPILLISGTLDGRTPPSNAEEVMKYLPNAQPLIIAGAGHSDPLFLSSPLILEEMLHFMRGKKIRRNLIKL